MCSERGDGGVRGDNFISFLNYTCLAWQVSLAVQATWTGWYLGESGLDQASPWSFPDSVGVSTAFTLWPVPRHLSAM